MAEETAPTSSEKSINSIDLDALSGLNFGPDWADEKSSSSSKHKHFEERGSPRHKDRRSGPPASRDRRSGGRPPADRGAGNQDRSAGNQDRGARTRRDAGRSQPAPTFEPTVNVDLFPQDEAFDALVKRLRTSARTYQLFEIAHLLLEKPERYVVVVAPKQKQASKPEAEPLLYYSVPGHLPFESEEEAVNYVLQEQLELFFEVETIEVDPPKGNFVMVNRCGITGELLGPPNYHRYQEFAQRHYASRISGMSYERFQSKIVGSKDQADIDAWLESMKTGACYKVKDRQEGEPESFDSLEAARRFLISHRKDKVVGSGTSVRFAGRDIERLPKGNIRQSVETYIEQQKHFPLDSANNIRGRLRRHKFAVYKKGSKGVSYVCAVKRRFRDSKTVFTDSIRNLIDFIEQHADIPASKLPKEYIGIDIEKQQPEVLKMQEAPAANPASPAADNPAAAAEAQPAAVDKPASAESVPAAATAETSDTTTEPAAPATDSAPETEAPAAPVAVEASTQAKPKAVLNAADQKQLNQLMLDLRWLITEGYVTEYGNGRLFAPAPLPEPNKKSKEPKGEKPAQAAKPDAAPAAAPAPQQPASNDAAETGAEAPTAADESLPEPKPPAASEAAGTTEAPTDATHKSALDEKESPKDLS